MPVVAPPYIMRSYGGTDIGRRRSVNEDAYLCDDELGLWVVADGMGRHNAGDIQEREQHRQPLARSDIEDPPQPRNHEGPSLLQVTRWLRLCA